MRLRVYERSARVAENQDLNDLPIEDLEAMMRGEKPIPGADTPPAEPSGTEPIPEPSTEEAPASETETAETAPAETTVEDDEKEILRAQVEEARALARKQEMQAKRNESLAGKHAGELGYLKERMKALEQMIETRRAEDPSLYEERPAPAPQQEPQRRGDDLADYLRSLALERGANRFESMHPDVHEFIPQIGEYMKSHMPQYDNNTSPAAVEQEVMRAFGEAYWDVKAAKHRANAEMREKRRAEQFGRQKEAKAQAVISGSAASPAIPAREQKTLEEMSVQELEKELVRLTRK